MSESEKQKVLRYAELAFKEQRKEAKPTEIWEMEEIRQELKMTHEVILELATKKLFPED